jgi:hypothetical protein
MHCDALLDLKKLIADVESDEDPCACKLQEFADVCADATAFFTYLAKARRASSTRKAGARKAGAR